METRAIFVALLCLAVLALTARAERAQGPADRHSSLPATEADTDTDNDNRADTGASGDRVLVVIDPGHGGGNVGAPGVTESIREKHVTLPLARALAERLREQGYRVRMTRERDEYLTLRQRVTFANRVGADLFISVHANATPTHAQRGYETYVLSARAIDVDGRALRPETGRPRPGVDADVAAVLDDVERGLAQETAALLAARIQTQLGRVWNPADDRGVKQDSMHVLLGATMPAVLVEVGFVDHAIEGRALLDPAVQTKLCEALTDAVRTTLPPSRVASADESR